MASNVYRQAHADGTSRPLRRSVKQGRKPSGLAKPELIRLYADDDAKLQILAERMGYLWNRNEFVRMAVRNQLCNSVYTELLKH